MIVTGEDSLLPREPEIGDLVGLCVVKAEMIAGTGDADEKVLLTFDNDWQLEVGTSEWLSVTIKQGNARPTTAGA
jgi:hypothetical protein